MMAEVSPDAWVCPECSYENVDYQRCMGIDCDTVRPGCQFDTTGTSAELPLSLQPPPSSGRRSTISVAKNHPAAAARQSKNPPPPRRESPGRAVKTNASENITLLSGRKQNPTGTRLPSRHAPLRDLTPPPPIAPPVSDALDNSFAAGDAHDNSFDAVDTGGEGGLVDLSAVEMLPPRWGEGRFFQLIRQAMIRAMSKSPTNRHHCLGLRSLMVDLIVELPP